MAKKHIMLASKIENVVDPFNKVVTLGQTYHKAIPTATLAPPAVKKAQEQIHKLERKIAKADFGDDIVRAVAVDFVSKRGHEVFRQDGTHHTLDGSQTTRFGDWPFMMVLDPACRKWPKGLMSR
jgi:hypothetical protein